MFPLWEKFQQKAGAKGGLHTIFKSKSYILKHD